MAAPSAVRSGVGVRDFQVFALDTNGFPAATSTTVYAGIDVQGVRDVTFNDPEPRLITHYGDDRIFALDTLPPTDTLTGQVRTSKKNDTLYTALTGNNVITIGEMTLTGVNTNLKGSENQVGVLVYQQSLDTDESSSTYGKRIWEIKLCPIAQIIPLESGFSENPEENVYTLRPQFATKHLWGTSFSATTEGFTQAQLLHGASEYKPRLVAFKGDGSTTTFTWSSIGTAVSTSKVAIVNNGTITTTAITVGTTSVIFTTAPTSGNIVVVKFEVANTSGD